MPDQTLAPQTLQTASGVVEFADIGQGPPVLYFHGTGIEGHTMAQFELDLVDAGFRLIAINRPGYGRTPLLDRRSSPACAEVAAALLTALEIERAAAMGSSGGAAFAAAFARHQPNRTSSLTLLCPQLHRWTERRWLPRHSGWTLPLLRSPWLRHLLLRLYVMQFPRSSVEQLLRLEAGGRFDEVRQDEQALQLAAQTHAAMCAGIRYDGFRNDFAVFVNEDILTETGQILAPTLVLHDSHDPMAPVDHVSWFQSLAPQCETVELHAAGHLVWSGRDAERMRAARSEFLRRHAQHIGQHE